MVRLWTFSRSPDKPDPHMLLIHPDELAPPATRVDPVVCFGVVLPVHDEEELLPAALAALDVANPLVSGVDVGIAIVLDACTDASRDLAMAWRAATGRSRYRPIDIIETDAANVGQARRTGFEALLRRWSDVDVEHIWLATTDADSEVPRNWISSQLAVRSKGGQVWAGGVSVRDWSGRVAGTAERWQEQYEAERLPIHGANFGIGAAMYIEAGGFDRLPTGEDRDLFERTVALGALIGHDPNVRVVTSSRRVARAPLGFADALTYLEGLPPVTTDVARFLGHDAPARR